MTSISLSVSWVTMYLLWLINGSFIKLPAKESCEFSNGYFLNEDDIIDLRYELRNAFDTVISDLNDPEPVKPLLATTVRLAFHDCGGGFTPKTPNISAVCDGCMNLDNPEHAGLAYARNALDDIYEKSIYNWYKKMSRADFWMISGTIAVEYGVELSNIPGNIEEIGYFCGRTDCSSSPTTTEVFPFPPALGCMQDLVDWFEPRFGFNEFDIVGILGAHTLGMGHRDASGFEGPWVDSENKDKLDNEYYLELKGPTHSYSEFTEWTQVEAPGNNGWQWTPATHDPASGELPLLMLNADMVNERDICTSPGLDDNGKVIDSDCREDNRECPFSSATAQDAMIEYQQSNQDWLDAFAPLFRRMITTGSDINQLCRVRKKSIVSNFDSSDSSDSGSGSSDDAKYGGNNDNNHNLKSAAETNKMHATKLIVAISVSGALLIMALVVVFWLYRKSKVGSRKKGHVKIHSHEEMNDDEINEGKELAALCQDETHA